MMIIVHAQHAQKIWHPYRKILVDELNSIQMYFVACLTNVKLKIWPADIELSKLTPQFCGLCFILTYRIININIDDFD